MNQSQNPISQESVLIVELNRLELAKFLLIGLLMISMGVYVVYSLFTMSVAEFYAFARKLDLAPWQLEALRWICLVIGIPFFGLGLKLFLSLLFQNKIILHEDRIIFPLLKRKYRRTGIPLSAVRPYSASWYICFRTDRKYLTFPLTILSRVGLQSSLFLKYEDFKYLVRRLVPLDERRGPKKSNNDHRG